MFQAFDIFYELKSLKITYEILLSTGIGKTVNNWIKENTGSPSIRDVTIREANKVLRRWRDAMQAQQKGNDTSDSSGDSS